MEVIAEKKRNLQVMRIFFLLLFGGKATHSFTSEAANNLLADSNPGGNFH